MSCYRKIVKLKIQVIQWASKYKQKLICTK